MAYRFERADSDLGAALKRIAREEAARAREEIADETLTVERTIHQARKRTKRLRGMLRLVRPAFPAFDAENAHIRNAARGLSRLRDRDVMIATHDRLMEETGADRRRYAPIRAHLTRARNRVAAEQDPAAALARYASEIAAIEARAGDWTVTAADRAVLESGLARTWEKARRAMKRARKGEDIEDLHEWRKRVKDHWYQARLLTPIAPRDIKRQADLAGELGEILGDLHDLDVYRNHLDGPEASGLDAGRRAELVSLATHRIGAMEREAFRLGGELFARKPAALASAWGTRWEEWRAGETAEG